VKSAGRSAFITGQSPFRTGLLKVCGIDTPADLERLRVRLTATYHLLDPTLPAEGRRLARWRIRVNVTPEEIETLRST
jgi:predicted transcriptional regulator of viral defense system